MEALDTFLALLFPEVHAQVDKLVKVWTKEGIECWVLNHIEVQMTHDPVFPIRMCVYNYRVFDRYNRPMASLPVLADDDPTGWPREFRKSLFCCEVGIRFPFMKLLDFAAPEAVLRQVRTHSHRWCWPI
ncbi:MAG TPA: hypothetical protein VKU02_09755 [Gemmataceae bacterium]|nr:hypothetical protein [Gemmataceae bacterium]